VIKNEAVHAVGDETRAAKKKQDYKNPHGMGRIERKQHRRKQADNQRGGKRNKGERHSVQRILPVLNR
jgi:hypothetical protein